MFSRNKFGSSKRGYNFGNTSKDSYGNKKKHGKTFIIFNKRKHSNKNHHQDWKYQDEDNNIGVITTSDSKMETLSDIADGVQPVGKLSLIEPSSPSSSSSIQHNNNDELDAINHIVSKEPSSMTEKNGFNNYDNKVAKNDTKNDDDCFVKCLYVTQQCCECVIL